MHLVVHLFDVELSDKVDDVWLGSLRRSSFLPSLHQSSMKDLLVTLVREFGLEDEPRGQERHELYTYANRLSGDLNA